MKTSKKFVQLLKKIFPHRSKIAKLSKNPMIKWLYNKMIFEKNNLTVLPKNKVVEIEINKKIKPAESIVLPSQIVEYFIDKANYHFIMDFCICRESMNCQNHPKELGCLFIGDATKDITPDFGHAATKEEAKKHVEKCREEGLIHTIGRDKIDEMWLGTKPEKDLMVVCNCCHCCCLWRMLTDLDKELGLTVKKMPGVKVEITDKCVGCRRCENICFVEAINVKKGKAEINDECRGCGRCVEICPHDAIKISIEDNNFIEKTIERIKSSVDVT
ncbi:MAG: 4Fe-4S binding protein [Candidatus Thermoplasmatota archaeon]